MHKKGIHQGSRVACRTFAASIRIVGGERETAEHPFFFPDQHRHDWLEMNPAIPVRTPNLKRLAERGVRFTQVFTPSPLCAPARVCLAAGKEYDRCRVPDNVTDYPINQTTFYTLLRENGYHVMGCGKFDLHKATFDWGLDGKRLIKEWGFSYGIDNAGKRNAVASGAKEPKDPYMAFLKKRGLLDIHVEDFKKRVKDIGGYTFPTPLPDDAYCDNWVAGNGLKLLRHAPEGKPWFLQVNFTGPYPPWDVTKRMHKLYENVDFPQPNRCTEVSPEDNLATRRNYSAMIENIDHWLGVYIEELKRRGEWENTIIVYSSDHGEALGDHNWWGKFLPDQPSVGVPLILAGPGIRKGLVSDALVSIMDLAATFLGYAGVPRPADMDSLSLKPLLCGKKNTHREYVLSGLERWRLVFDGRYKLSKGYKGTLLFDLKTDPLENNNLADTSKDQVERLARILDAQADA